MKLVDVYSTQKADKILYALLKERTKDQSISHKEMPSFDEHVEFVKSRPYPYWYLIADDVGAIYLTEQREIGIFIFKSFQGMRFATKAINELMEMHPGKFLANINPGNEASISLFTKIGFKHIQNTYEL